MYVCVCGCGGGGGGGWRIDREQVLNVIVFFFQGCSGLSAR